MVLFLTNCFSGGLLRDVHGATLTFEQARPSQAVLGQAPITADSTGLLAAALVRRRGGSSWDLRPVALPLPNARHFMDCLQELNSYIVSEIPTANRRQKVAFAMEKGQVMDFGTSLDSVTLGLGWDVGQISMDLDASAILFNQAGEVLESIFFGNLRSCGPHSAPGAVQHSGDSITGEGEGDDEQITVRLTQLGEAVKDVFFCIHSYSKDDAGRPRTFKDVANPYCRVVEGTGREELCRYTLSDAGDRSGLIIARLRRGADGRFGFNALGLPSRGTMYKDSIEDMKKLCQVDPRTLQRMGSKILQAQTTQLLDNATGAGSSAQAPPRAVPRADPIAVLDPAQAQQHQEKGCRQQ